MSKPWFTLLLAAGLGSPTAAPGSNAPVRAQPVLPAWEWDGTPSWLELASSVPEAATVSVCPADMVWVDGSYCTDVRHHCRTWLDDPTLPYARCGEYEPVARCVGPRRPLSFCIDRFEYTRRGEGLPDNQMSFVKASALCRSLGKRICTEAEWNFACEGEAMLPYPYGWRREPKCNQDRSDLFQMTLVGGKRVQVKKDHREPADAHPDCVSPFGVYDMVGNLDEPVLREEARFAQPFRNALKGGWWMAARNRCRPATTAHDDYYEDSQVGVRCCADLPATSVEPRAVSTAPPPAPRSSVRRPS